MTKTTNILTELENIFKAGLTSKKAYIDLWQKWLLTFINNYDTSLSKNSEPLLKFLKRIDKVDKTKVTLWLIRNTSLDSLEVKKEGCKIKLKEGYNALKCFDESLSWYSMKIEIKEVTFDDEHLKKSLTNILKHYDKNVILRILNTL